MMKLFSRPVVFLPFFLSFFSPWYSSLPLEKRRWSSSELLFAFAPFSPSYESGSSFLFSSRSALASFSFCPSRRPRSSKRRPRSVSVFDKGRRNAPRQKQVHKKLGNHDRRRRRSSLVGCSVRPRTSERRSVRSSYYERNHVRSSIVQRTFLPQNQKYQISFLPLVTQKQTFFFTFSNIPQHSS